MKGIDGAMLRLQAEGRAAVCQTKSVCHTARNGPIACILLGGEKVPWLIGGLFHRPEKTGEERLERRGYPKEKALRRWRKKGESAKAGCLRFYYIVP